MPMALVTHEHTLTLRPGERRALALRCSGLSLEMGLEALEANTARLALPVPTGRYELLLAQDGGWTPVGPGPDGRAHLSLTLEPAGAVMWVSEGHRTDKVQLVAMTRQGDALELTFREQDVRFE